MALASAQFRYADASAAYWRGRDTPLSFALLGRNATWSPTEKPLEQPRN